MFTARLHGLNHSPFLLLQVSLHISFHKAEPGEALLGPLHSSSTEAMDYNLVPQKWRFHSSLWRDLKESHASHRGVPH